MNRRELESIAARLDRLLWVPTGVLSKIVTEDGLCFWAFTRGDVPEMTGEEPADQQLAARLCAGCPVQDECLELDLREAGPTAIGVWGAMTDDGRRELHPVWLARNPEAGGGAS